MGNDAEKALSQALEHNENIIRLSATLRDATARNNLEKWISRNREIGKKIKSKSFSKKWL